LERAPPAHEAAGGHGFPSPPAESHGFVHRNVGFGGKVEESMMLFHRNGGFGGEVKINCMFLHGIVGFGGQVEEKRCYSTKMVVLVEKLR